MGYAADRACIRMELVIDGTRVMSQGVCLLGLENAPANKGNMIFRIRVGNE
jgi:hypothetical protein